jgi:Antibiotic biosynthesis monooxygenase
LESEPGCLSFLPHHDVTDPRGFFVYEHFADRAAHTRHTQTEHSKNIVDVQIMPRVGFEMHELELCQTPASHAIG